MLLDKFFHFGVLSRDAVRNDLEQLRDLLRSKFVQRVPKKGQVFYELTEKALPLLEEHRQRLFHDARLHLQLQRHAKFYRALLGESRFLNERHPKAERYKFLGDWQLARPVVPSQLKLAKMRFYQERGLF